MTTAAQRAQTHNDVFLHAGSTDVREFAKNRSCTRVLCDYYLYHEHDAQKAFDLCLAAEQEGR